MASFLVLGGAGFIGSHMTEHLLRRSEGRVKVYDNFSSGQDWHLEGLDRSRLTVLRGDIKELPRLQAAMQRDDLVIHFASNPDIARAIKEPSIDFWEGTYLTQNVLEVMRQSGARDLLYVSGSGVYGDRGEDPCSEADGCLQPISAYGASKLACEAMICAYCHMFDFRAVAFRFANVVGPRQTHGVTYDFVRKLQRDPTRLPILGDGSQSKAYIHVDDVVSAMLGRYDAGMSGYEVFNVATEDYVTVREVADLVVHRMGLSDVQYEFTGGSRGWKGDVPVVRFDSRKLRSHGWAPQRSSREALEDAIDGAIRETQGKNLKSVA